MHPDLLKSKLDDFISARAKAMGVTSIPVDLKSVMELGSKIGDVVDGKMKSVVHSALLASYYLANLREHDPVELEDLVHFINEGSLQLSSVLVGMRDAKTTTDKGN